MSQPTGQADNVEIFIPEITADEIISCAFLSVCLAGLLFIMFSGVGGKALPTRNRS
ncbi:MAG TPA: hypothetical protein VMI31_17870 [Fimbriimonadaceae bacterium]|nr:hypothetical protein [Fimbriimonadaceae bacterium]